MTISEVSGLRLAELQAEMEKAGVDLVAIAPTSNMHYLAGFMPFPDERLCTLLVGRGSVRFVVPELNADHVEANTGMETIRWTDASGPGDALEDALSELNVGPGLALAADASMRADTLLRLQDAIRPKRSISASGLMGVLRMRKSEDEIDALLNAAALADEALLAGAEACRPGRTEREVAAEIVNSFRESGVDSVDFTSVGSGPNGAFPHHMVSDRVLLEGDTIVLDIGATLNGYHSDVARVVHLGEPSDELMTAYQVVREANRLGREAAVAGANARDVDRAARNIIEQAGYGELFLHRTGHGLGLDVHEMPWITSDNETVLEAGMVFSIEPGIYLAGRFGVRIEDIVVVTENECRRLTGLDHELIVIDG